MPTRKLYTHKVDVDSSVLDKLYWNNETRELFVKFKSGTIAGYANVGDLDFQRLKGAWSVGTHWNSNIKNNPYFPGINGDVELISIHDAIPAQDTVATNPEALNTYKVTVTIEVTFSVEAGNDNQALELVSKEANDVFGDDTKVIFKEVTRVIE